MKIQESYVFEDDEYENLNRNDDEMNEKDTCHQNAIEEKFLHASETLNSYVNEAIDASLNYDYLDSLSQLSKTFFSSIYYSALSAKSFLDFIKRNIISSDNITAVYPLINKQILYNLEFS